MWVQQPLAVHAIATTVACPVVVSALLGLIDFGKIHVGSVVPCDAQPDRRRLDLQVCITCIMQARLFSERVARLPALLCARFLVRTYAMPISERGVA